MPTEEMFKLYERMAGGTGDINQDAHIAKHLQRLVDVPEREIISFVRTRDRGTVHKLRDVLKDMPRGQNMAIGGPRAGTRPLPTGMGAMNADSTKLKFRDLTSCRKTTYSHLTDGCGIAGPPRTHAVAFDGIVKAGFRPYFEDWRSQADESKVAVFADACRSLRQFTMDKSAPTCYKEMFTFPDQKDIRPPPEKNNKKNKAVLTILTATASEKQALAGRDQTFRDTLTKAYAREKDILDGTALLPHNRLGMSLCTYSGVPEAKAEECLKGDMMEPKMWRSEGKVAWHSGMHQSMQIARHGISRDQRGTMKLRLEGCAADTKRRPLAGAHHGSQSSPSLSRTA